MSRARLSSSGSERGAALLVVLLLVAVMSLVALGVSEAISFSARRDANVAARAQAGWYLRGAEELARQTIRRSFELDNEVTTLEQPWAAGPLRFDIDGGVMEGELRDASNCFNLNALAPGRFSADDEEPSEDASVNATATLRHLLRALDVDEGSASRLAAGAADWIDADERSRTFGAEDYDYSFADPPYRPANTPFTEVEELRAVAGLSEGVFRTVRPYLCARRDAAPLALNVNTLTESQAPLLSALFEGRLSVDDAQEVIRARPSEGWRDVDEFWNLEVVARHAVEESVRDQIGVRACYFELRARVHFYDAYAEGRTLFRVGADGLPVLVRRSLGETA